MAARFYSIVTDTMVETPYSAEFDDIYFAVEDGLAESRYVYLEQNNLPAGWQDKDYFVIAETGFGTGLNFLCAWDLFEKTTKPQQRLHYYSFEKYPLAAGDILRYLQHWSAEFGGRLEKLVADYPSRVGGWHTLRVSPQVTLTVIFDDVNRALPELDTPVDCWFLDGHAPAKNPDMWSETIFQSMKRLSRTGAHVATFTAAGFVRRGLRDAGFTVRKARGFGFKCDMNIGVLEQENPQPPARLKQTPKTAVIGGGIAGAAMAAALISRGCDVTLFEKNGIASGGSGNIRGLCNPRFTAQRGVESDFYGPAFALAQRTFSRIAQVADIGYQACGSVHLITDAAKEKRLRGFVDNWGWHADHARWLEKDEASAVTGVSLSHAALFLPDAAMVSPRAVTAYLARDVRVVPVEIDAIYPVDGKWQVGRDIFDAVVLCGGADTARFVQVAHVPLQKVRGQVTRVRTSPAYDQLKTNLCYGGYSSVAFGGEAVIGSTFQHWIDDDALRPEDDTDNLQKLRNVAPDLAEGLEIFGARASFRCAAKDRFPVIGRVDGQEGLYISTAHGSHGILSSLMAAETLAADICGTPHILPRSVRQALSAGRF